MFLSFKVLKIKIIHFKIFGIFPKKLTVFIKYPVLIKTYCVLTISTGKSNLFQIEKERVSFSFQNFNNGSDFFKTLKVKKKELIYNNVKQRIKKKKKICSKFPAVQYLDYAGIESFLPEIQEDIEWPLMYSELYEKFGVSTSKGILFTGYPGTGKTLLAHVIAGELELPFFYFSASNIISSISGNSQKNIKKIFWEAEKKSPCIIFIDELDIIAPNRDSIIKEVDKKSVGQLLICIDEIRLMKKKPIILLAATNNADAIDSALRRPGRFDKEVKFFPPDSKDRFEIISHFSKKIKFCEKLDMEYICKKTHGFTSGDLSELINSVLKETISRIGSKLFCGKYRNNFLDIKTIFKTNKVDLIRALKKIDPGIIRNGFTLPPRTFWNEIGGLEKIRNILNKYIIKPIKTSNEKFNKIQKKFGVLLFGPPGCGKTLIARATAYESNANFISIKGPEILNKFLGESEKSIRTLFQKARLCPPTIIFFDEFDSISNKRSGSSDNESTSSPVDRIVNQLLTEMDGLERNENIYFIGATNRPDIIDRAFFRPGRLDKLIPISLPKKEQKIRILSTICQKNDRIPYLNIFLHINILKKELSGAHLSQSIKESIIDAHEKKVAYCILTSGSNGISIRFFCLMGNKNILNGLKRILESIILKKKFSWQKKKKNLKIL